MDRHARQSRLRPLRGTALSRTAPSSMAVNRTCYGKAPGPRAPHLELWPSRTRRLASASRLPQR